MTRTLVVAAVSARLLAEAAVREGFRVIAIDAFGDADTRRAAALWLPLAQPGRMTPDAERVLAALRRCASEPGGIGWIAGAGFDAAPGWLDQAAESLPLLGTAPAALRALRDPAQWFAALARLAIAHPPSALTLPADRRDWLIKDLHGSGGWEVRDACGAQGLRGAEYAQRELAGRPVSLLFVADAAGVRTIGCQWLLSTSIGDRRHVFAGVIGPLTLPPLAERALLDAASALASAFDVRGLASLDALLLDDGGIAVLELNARPPASLALYPDHGLIGVHLAACGVTISRSEMPSPSPTGTARALRGTEIVYARHALHINAATAVRLAARPDVHDWPAANSRFDPGQPVCSLAVTGGDHGTEADTLRAMLAAMREALLDELENLS